jgi:hypothetical protein
LCDGPTADAPLGGHVAADAQTIDRVLGVERILEVVVEAAADEV